MVEVLHIATVGKYEHERVDFVTRKKKMDKLVLVHSAESKENALKIQEHIGKTFCLDLIEVDPWNYHQILAEVLTVAYKHRKKKLVFNPSLGTRVMSAALMMAAIFTDSPMQLVKEEAGVHTDVLELLPIKQQKISKQKKNILRMLAESENGCVRRDKDLGSRASLALATISGHLKKLIKAGYVERLKSQDIEGRVGTCITDLGRIMIKVADYWK